MLASFVTVFIFIRLCKVKDDELWSPDLNCITVEMNEKQENNSKKFLAMIPEADVCSLNFSITGWLGSRSCIGQVWILILGKCDMK